MITPVLETKGTKPLYEQLYDAIREKIEDGALEKGAKLPSKRSLAAHLSISQSTVEHAYEQLMAEGYVESRPRSGYFVGNVEGSMRKRETLPPVRRPPAQTAAPFHPDRLAGDIGSIYPDRLAGDLGSPHPDRLAGDLGSPRYDLRTNAVDTNHFPYTVWQRLMRENIRDVRGKLLAQSRPEGNPGLRLEIARYLREYRGVEAAPEQIILGAGMEFLLGMLADLLRRAVFAFEDPGYGKISKVLSVRGLQAIPVPMDGEGPQVAALEKSGADLIFTTPACHFPLGVTMSYPRRQQLLHWASGGPDRFIIEDDFNCEFRYVLKPAPTLHRLDASGKVIYINSFAGTLAPSLRVAYMVLPESLIPVYQEKMSFYSCSVSEFEQGILRSFMGGGYYGRHLSRMRKIYSGRREALLEGLAPLGDRLKTGGQKAGLHLLLTVQGASEATLIKKAGEQGVRVYPLSGYSVNKESAQETVVAGFAAHKSADLRKIGALLAEAWKTKEA
jgi:GntR family transcriptional regulator/MocR family aminotransferase